MADSISHPLWEWGDLCQALQLPVVAGPPVRGICIDSRKCKPGDLFVALSGKSRHEFNIPENSARDGHSFIQNAIDNGAIGVLAHKHVPEDIPALIAEESLEGLWRLARYRRTQLACPVIALTGSSGKTTLKQFIQQSTGGSALEGSLNNHIGVPLSMASTPKGASYAIYELGTNHLGEIEVLAKLARPNIAIVMNVHPAHIGNFDNFESLVREKLSIGSVIEPNGNFLVPHELLGQIPPQDSSVNILSHGSSPDADIYFEAIGNDQAQITSSVEQLKLPIPGGGQHRAQTLCVAAAVLTLLTLPLRNLRNITADLPQGRGNIHELGNLVVIDESYNANPASMQAAITALCARSATRRLAVVGTMNELGERSARYHVGLIPQLNRVDGVICVGELMDHVFENLDPNVQLGYFDKPNDALLECVCTNLQDGDCIMIKASNSIFWVNSFVSRLVERIKQNQLSSDAGGVV